MPAVKDIMSKNVITIAADKNVFEAAELMTNKGIGCLRNHGQSRGGGIILNVTWFEEFWQSGGPGYESF